VPWRIAVPAVAALAGVLFVASALSADGIDLRSNTTDLSTLVKQRADAVAALRSQQQELRGEVAALTAQVDGGAVAAARRRAASLAPPAGLSPVRGPGLRVALNDAPRDQEVPAGIDPNFLVVHQQDIQAFVNALWAGGATAVSLQGQRLISTTGIKCVGNTVVMQGVPYSPPYVIEAVGDPAALQSGLDGSASVQNYRDYVDQVALGLSVAAVDQIDIPAYEGDVRLTHARPAAPVAG
jgi:uncharacterized protein YlxW (UPF0749 family)